MNMQISYAHCAFKTPMGIFDGVGILDSMGGHLMCNELRGVDGGLGGGVETWDGGPTPGA
jgi:hypothetical protein